MKNLIITLFLMCMVLMLGFGFGISPMSSPGRVRRPPRVSGAVVDTNLLMWLEYGADFDGSGLLLDSTANANNGIQTNSNFQASWTTNILDFDPADDYFLIDTNLPFTLGDGRTNISISLWVKPDSTTINAGILYFGDLASSQGELSWVWGGSGFWNCKMNNNAFDKDLPFKELSAWHHFVMTWDGVNVRLYVDKFLCLTEPQAAALNMKALKAAIGTYYTTGFNYDGEMSYLKVYDTVISSATISTNFNEGSALSPQPQALTGGVEVARYGLESNFIDSISGQTGVNHSATFTNDSMVGSWALYCEADQYFDTVNSTLLAGTNTYTIGLWVKFHAHEDDGGLVYMVGTKNFGLSQSSADGQVEGRIATANSADQTQTGTFKLSTNQWYYVVATARPFERVRTYIDGIDKSLTKFNLATLGEGTYETFAQDDFFKVPFREAAKGSFCTIDDVTIWTKTLSSNEVYQMYLNRGGTP